MNFSGPTAFMGFSEKAKDGAKRAETFFVFRFFYPIPTLINFRLMWRLSNLERKNQDT